MKTLKEEVQMSKLKVQIEILILKFEIILLSILKFGWKKVCRVNHSERP